jgi:hypothetical protein
MRFQCLILALVLLLAGWYAWKRWGKRALKSGGE